MNTHIHFFLIVSYFLMQKGCKRGSHCCKNQLLKIKMILENCHNLAVVANLSITWIDYKKAIDSVLHS